MRARAWIWCVAVLSTGGPALAQGGPAKATLADVAFIAGHWKGDVGGSLSEEVWTSPAGDSMVGMWRLVTDGQVRVFEFLTIVQDTDGPTFRLRHFDRQGVGREEKDKPIALKLVSWKPGEAAFEGRDATGTGTMRLTYRRTGDATLAVTLEKPNTPPQEFTFRLATAIR